MSPGRAVDSFRVAASQTCSTAPIDAACNATDAETEVMMRWKRAVPIFLVVVGVGYLVGSYTCGVVDKMKVQGCASMMKDIAACLIQYSNAHEGHYPDHIEDLLPTGLSTVVLTCPATDESPATGSVQAMQAEIAAGKHCSYIYVGGGLKADLPADVVIVYEPLTNHGGRGMNVLFNDYHVEFLDAKSAEAMLKSHVAGMPLTWPVTHGVHSPSTSATER